MNEFITKKIVDAQIAKDETGAAGVEYGILVAAIAAGIVVLAFTIGDNIVTAFQTVADALDANI